MRPLLMWKRKVQEGEFIHTGGWASWPNTVRHRRTVCMLTGGLLDRWVGRLGLTAWLVASPLDAVLLDRRVWSLCLTAWSGRSGAGHLGRLVDA